MELRATTGSEAYLDLLRLVNDRGEPTSPRGQGTRELLNFTVTVESAAEAHTLATQRRLNLDIHAVEHCHMVGGFSSLPQLDEAGKGRFARYANDGRLLGAYGPRIYNQLPLVVRKLREDPDTRQAVITVWNGSEHQVQSGDVPCTQSFQFLIRGGKLHLRVVMRSSDVYLGVPYDWLNFSRFQLEVANILDLEPGSFTHTAGSMHLYDRDRAMVSEVVKGGVLPEPRLTVPPPLPTHKSAVDLPVAYQAIYLQGLARNICLRWDTWACCEQELTAEGNDAVDWYLDHVKPYDEHAICPRCNYAVPRIELSDRHTFGHTVVRDFNEKICSECRGGF